MKIAVVADTHVKEKNNDYHLLIDLLENLTKEDFDFIVLLGDIFEFYCDSEKKLSESVSDFVNFLERISRDKKIVLIEGNHEFGVSIKGVKIEPFQWSVKIAGQKVIFTHGDVIASLNPLFPPVRGLLHSEKFVNLLCPLLPSTLLWKVAMKISSNSRNNGKIDSEEVNRRLKKFFLIHDEASYVAAHSHRSFFVQNGKRFLIVVGAWYMEHNYAIITDKRIEIKKWEKK